MSLCILVEYQLVLVMMSNVYSNEDEVNGKYQLEPHFGIVIHTIVKTYLKTQVKVQQ